MKLQPSFLQVIILASLLSCDSDNEGVIIASGTIEGTDIHVGSEVAGRVADIRVDEGSTVRQGDTLIVLDDTDYQIQFRQAKANLEAAEATYRLALLGSRKEDILQAEAAFKTAQSDYRRARDLLATGTVTQKQYDDAYARYISAQQMHEKLVSGLRKEEIVAARARRDQAAAIAEQLKKKLRDCRILAPADGVITLKSVERGEIVSVGGSVLRITQLDPVTLVIYVNEVDLGGIRVGQEAEVCIDANPEVPFRGSVIFTSPVAEFTPKNVQTTEERTKLVFAVKIRIPNPGGVLKPGMPADARLVALSDKDTDE